MTIDKSFLIIPILLASCQKVPNQAPLAKPIQISQCGRGILGSWGVLHASATWAGTIPDFNAESGDVLAVFQKDDSMPGWEVVTDTGPVVFRLDGPRLTLTSTSDIDKSWYYQALVDSCN